MKNVNPNVLSAASNATQNGPQIDASQLYQLSIQSKGTNGDEVGTIKIQMSNDPCPDGTGPSGFVVTNWTDIPSASAAMAAGAAAPIYLSIVSSRWIRIVYTRTSGGASNKLIRANMFGISA